MMSLFYSHSKEINGEIVGTKLLSDHIKNVQTLAISNKGILNSSFKEDSQIYLLKQLATFHDLGKYSSFFQKYLLGKHISNPQLKNHSKIGAYALYHYLKDDEPLLAPIGYYIVKSHHSNLVNLTEDSLFSSSERILLQHQFEIQHTDLKLKYDIIKKELGVKNINNIIRMPDKTLRGELRQISNQSNIENYFLVNYLFSVLVESDKIDASDTAIYECQNISNDLVGKYISNYKKDELKDYVRKTVTNYISRSDFQYNSKLFTLTAPTGIGKTLTALEFALKIRTNHFNKTGELKKIIYALPFINIIEQAIEVYNEVITNNGKIIAHYQYSPLDDNGEISYNQKLMLLETWQADIVITTFVQLLETIISNKNSSLKKFHHLYNSILILDEVQAIDLKKLPLVGAMLYYLSKYLGTTVLLMTATKPLILELANSVLLDDNEQCSYTELLKDHEEIFKKFNRTKLVAINLHKEIDIDEFLPLLKNHYNDRKSILVVCNKIDTSLRYFYKVKKYFFDLGYTILYLSTNFIHSDRLKIINKVKSLINSGKKVILISTQSIEAGVDLSFETGFRDLAPLDSIIQVAGRVNRYNNPANKNAPLYIFNSGDCKTIYGSLAEQVVVDLLTTSGKEINEEDYLQLINSYFKKISSLNHFDESVYFFEAIKRLEYTNSNTDKCIADFKLIEESDYKISVFIENDERATEVLDIFKIYLAGKCDKSEFEKVKSTFYQHVLQVPKVFESQLPKTDMLTDNIYLVSKEMLEQFYNSETGFIRIDEQKKTTNLYF